jgi:hypothetical protein
MLILNAKSLVEAAGVGGVEVIRFVESSVRSLNSCKTPRKCGIG